MGKKEEMISYLIDKKNIMFDHSFWNDIVDCIIEYIKNIEDLSKFFKVIKELQIEISQYDTEIDDFVDKFEE